ncbi:hypothetical protein BDV93DRAFT_571803 [Ceratobasidium sp. AG-I]|nr:hypothetical protein BDV93DRAFT_571803 [Ceratobasidium sp. AG-I]
MSKPAYAALIFFFTMMLRLRPRACRNRAQSSHLFGFARSILSTVLLSKINFIPLGEVETEFRD